MLKADLHIHSTVSDGSDTISQIVEKAVKRGLDVIAVTDHDTLAHTGQIPADTRISVLAGVEISAIDPDTKVKAHILGYGIRDIAALEALTQPLLERRHNNSLMQIAILRRHGFIIDTTKLNKAAGRYVYKQHIMEHLVKTGQADGMFGSFYKTVFKNGGFCDFDINYINVFEAVEAVKAAGGLAVLAHSGQQQNFYLISRLTPLGLAGLECNHPAHSESDKAIIREYAKKYDLFLTGGSYYHGTNDANPVQIGDYLSEESGVTALC